ncbi:hypothetical protein DM02DRAFT_734589 [Periconia macrospinosa]|uniref:Uncharacterized protein n=1 Tax=Periconia macrospinosa TaxID=97972 RepID=A0A2V1CYQ8_9PLEO|nr:hypothetical protein DM02DRAFT_734589 [Periconia macrospinosa]
MLYKPGRRFIDIQALLKTTKQEGKLISTVISHVSDRDNNKPALRKDLVPTLQAKYSNKAEDKSRVLQQSVLHYVRKNTEDFTSSTLEHYLHEFPSGNCDAYGARFKHKVWRKLLSIITNFTGPTLQHKHVAGFIPEANHKISPPTIAQTARNLIHQIPKIINDPALQSKSAGKQLLSMIQPVIAQWISKQHKDVPNHHSKNEQPSIVHTVEEQGAATKPSLRASNSNASIQGQVSRKRVVLPWISEKSDTHGSMEEQAVVQSPKHRSKVASNAKTSIQPEGQSRKVINATIDGLNNLRKQHRHKSAARQQKAQVRHPSPTANSPQPTNLSQSLPPQAVTGSGHWSIVCHVRVPKVNFHRGLPLGAKECHKILLLDILRSPPPATATQPINKQQSDSSLNDGSKDDNKLYKNTLAYKIRDDSSEGTFGDEEHMLIASDQYS